MNSDGVLRALIDRGLIEEAGRDEGPGRPLLYATTPRFLERLGLPSLAALPSLAPLLSAAPGDLDAADELALRDERTSDQDGNVEPPAQPGDD